MSKKTTQTQTQQSHTVSTPTNPAWVESGLAGVGQKISDLGTLDPYSLIAGTNPLIDTAAQSASDLSTSPNYGTATDILTGLANGSGVSAASLLDNLSAYMSPYTNDVVNTTLAGFDQNAGRTRAQQQLDLANDSTFGGSGGSILRSLTEGELARTRAAQEATLRDQAFTTGANLSNLDAGRRQEASIFNQNQKAQIAQALASIGQAETSDQRQNIAAQVSMGDVLRQIEQAKLGAPVSMAQTMAGLYGSLPLQLLQGQVQDSNSTGTTTSKTSDPLGTIGSLAMLAAAPFTGGASLGLGALGGALTGGASLLSGLAGAGALAANAKALTTLGGMGS